jgi:hypothetical protein
MMAVSASCRAVSTELWYQARFRIRAVDFNQWIAGIDELIIAHQHARNLSCDARCDAHDVRIDECIVGALNTHPGMDC